MTDSRIGVIGAGTIGTSLAHALAETGHQVVLVDHDQTVLERSADTIAQRSRLRRLTGASPQSPSAVLESIETTTDLVNLRSCAFIVENIVENKDAKQALYGMLNDVTSQGTVIAVNTSCITVDSLAEGYAWPDRLIGIHFMNPVPDIKVAEMIVGPRTSDDTVRRSHELLESMNKSAVVVKDAPGFVSNRISHLMMNEAIAVVSEGTSSAADVDRLFEGCFGHRMGPLATADLIGLDTVANTLLALVEQLNDTRFCPHPLLTSMVERKMLGRKSGAGFFSYHAAREQSNG